MSMHMAVWCAWCVLSIFPRRAAVIVFLLCFSFRPSFFLLLGLVYAYHFIFFFTDSIYNAHCSLLGQTQRKTSLNHINLQITRE